MKRALVLMLLLVAACGGSDDTDPKAAYLEKAESACADANKRLDELNKQRSSLDLTKLPSYVHQLVDVAKQTLDEISALTPPEADATDVTAKLITPLTAQLSDAEAFATEIDVAAAKKDNTRLFNLVSNPPTETKVDIAWMKTYGFKECVKAADTGAAAK